MEGWRSSATITETYTLNYNACHAVSESLGYDCRPEKAAAKTLLF